MTFEVALEMYKNKKKYIVTKPGVRIHWMESIAPYAWGPKSIDVPVGSIIYYEGGGFGWGSDPGWEEYYSFNGRKGELYGSTDAIRQLSDNEWLIYLKSKHGIPTQETINKKKYPDCSADGTNPGNIIGYLKKFLKVEEKTYYPVENVVGRASFVNKKADISIQLWDLNGNFEIVLNMKKGIATQKENFPFLVNDTYQRIQQVLRKLCFEQYMRYSKVKRQ